MKTSTGGLRARIIWTTALVALISMAAIIGTVVLVLNAVTRNNAESKLDDRLSVIAAAIESDPDRTTGALSVPQDAIDDSSWLYASGKQIDGPKAGTAVQAVADSLSRVTMKTQVTRGERIYLASPVDLGRNPVSQGVLVVSESMEPYESTRTEVLVVLVALGIAVSAGVTAVAAWTMSRTMAPVLAMADLAEEWSEHELDARFEDADARNEIGHLGRTLNVLLDRVAGALRNEQRLTAELAHELRTPLTGIRGEAELALAEATTEDSRQRLTQVVALSDQMGTTITTLLALARGEQSASHAATAGEVIGVALTGRENDRIEFRIDCADDLRVSSTVDLAVRALSPLIDNAVRYASGWVTITARATGRAVQIEVSDDGPGVDPSVDVDSVFAPGVREPRSPGSGLGLALARRVARTLGGDVLVTRTSGPTTFVLVMPRA